MSFIQYENCSFCGVSHLQGNKHAYSTKHRKYVQNALTKFHDKIKTATTELSSKPDIELILKNTAEESQKMFWCITCGGSFNRHSIKGEYFIKNLGLIEHLIEDNHSKKLKMFWYIHRWRTMSDMSLYQIDANVQERILENVSEVESAFKANLKKGFDEGVEQIKKVEKEREALLWQVKAQELRKKRDMFKGRMKEQSRSQTSLAPPPGFPHQTPPILSNEQPEIGPSEDDFIIHKRRMEEKKSRGFTSKIRVDLSSKNSTSLHSKLWLPYKVRRSITRSQHVKGITEDVKNRYSCQSTSNDLQTFQGESSTNQDNPRFQDVDSINNLDSDPSNSLATIVKPYVSKRKILNQNGLPHPYNMGYF